MNITYRFQVRNLVLAATLSAGLSLMPSAFGQFAISYIMDSNGGGLIQLGTLGGQGTGALGINAAGRVVGFSTTTGGDIHAFIAGPNGVGMTDLGTLGGDSSFAFGINAAGQVVG